MNGHGSQRPNTLLVDGFHVYRYDPECPELTVPLTPEISDNEETLLSVQETPVNEKRTITQMPQDEDEAPLLSEDKNVHLKGKETVTVSPSKGSEDQDPKDQEAPVHKEKEKLNVSDPSPTHPLSQKKRCLEPPANMYNDKCSANDQEKHSNIEHFLLGETQLEGTVLLEILNDAEEPELIKFHVKRRSRGIYISR